MTRIRAKERHTVIIRAAQLRALASRLAIPADSLSLSTSPAREPPSPPPALPTSPNDPRLGRPSSAREGGWSLESHLHELHELGSPSAAFISVHQRPNRVPSTEFVRDTAL